MMSNGSVDVILVGEEEVKRHLDIIKNELPMLYDLLDDVESIIKLAYKLIALIDGKINAAESEYDDQQLCLRLRLARSLACNTAVSTVAIVSLLAEYAKDKT